MNRRLFLKTSLAAAALPWPAQPLWGSPKTKAPDADRPGDAEVLAQCRERIEMHRKGDGVITVRRSDGRPLQGVEVGLEQLRHEFLFGANCFLFNRTGDPGLEREYRERFAALLNYATLGFYWGAYEREAGKPDYAYTDEAADWCRGRGIVCKGHPLVWDHPVSTPGWLSEDLDEVERLSKQRVRDIVARFRDRIDIWDVVNEAAHLVDGASATRMADLGRKMGVVTYVEQHLRAARAVHPGARLIVNDYRVGPGFYTILEAMRQKGKLPFDAVGLQSHMHNGPWPLWRVWAICDYFARLQKPLHFTETTVVSGPRLKPGEHWGQTTPRGEESQAEAAAKFYTALFAHPAVEAVTWWDFSDHGAWQGAPAGWLRRDMTPKPVYERLMALVKNEWNTRACGVTNAFGRCRLRAFYGDHRVTLRLPNGMTCSAAACWRRGGKNRFELKLP